MEWPEGILRSWRCPVTRTLTCVPPTSTTRIFVRLGAADIIARSLREYQAQGSQSSEQVLYEGLNLDPQIFGKGEQLRTIFNIGSHALENVLIAIIRRGYALLCRQTQQRNSRLVVVGKEKTVFNGGMISSEE